MKTDKIIILILIPVLIILLAIAFASRKPDALETVISSHGAQECNTYHSK